MNTWQQLKNSYDKIYSGIKNFIDKRPFLSLLILFLIFFHDELIKLESLSQLKSLSPKVILVFMPLLAIRGIKKVKDKSIKISFTILAVAYMVCLFIMLYMFNVNGLYDYKESYILNCISKNTPEWLSYCLITIYLVIKIYPFITFYYKQDKKILFITIITLLLVTATLFL